MPRRTARSAPTTASPTACGPSGGAVFLTGTQALVRLLLMQRAARRGRRPGHAGLHQRLPRLAARHGRPGGLEGRQEVRRGRHALPAGDQRGARRHRGARHAARRVRPRAHRATACSRMWYGKGPGVDRAGDALKHGNAYGASPHGGVLVVAGDDHGCVSSSMPHQSDQAFQSWHMPIVAPANVAEYLEFGLYGWALSRFSGNWVGFTALSEVVESGSTVDLDLVERARRRLAGRRRRCARPPATRAPADGLHYRWPDLPSLKIEAAPARQARRGARLRARQQHRPRRSSQRRRRRSASSPAARRTSTCMEVLRRLDISLDDAGRGRRAPLQGGPDLSDRADAHAARSREGLDEILVDRGEGRRSSRRSCATCSTTRRGAAGDRRQARRARPAARLARSASCGLRG